VRVRVRVYKCRNAGLSGIRAVRYQNEKTNDAGTGPVLDQAKAFRHFLFRYWTEIINTGMPMLAFVYWMPMPSYAIYPQSPCGILTCKAPGRGLFCVRSMCSLPMKISTVVLRGFQVPSPLTRMLPWPEKCRGSWGLMISCQHHKRDFN
jgi:hypothetical protein